VCAREGEIDRCVEQAKPASIGILRPNRSDSIPPGRLAKRLDRESNAPRMESSCRHPQLMSAQQQKRRLSYERKQDEDGEEAQNRRPRGSVAPALRGALKLGRLLARARAGPPSPRPPGTAVHRKTCADRVPPAQEEEGDQRSQHRTGVVPRPMETEARPADFRAPPNRRFTRPGARCGSPFPTRSTTRMARTCEERLRDPTSGRISEAIP